MVDVSDSYNIESMTLKLVLDPGSKEPLSFCGVLKVFLNFKITFIFTENFCGTMFYLHLLLFT